MEITMEMKEDELQDIIDTKCYESLSEAREPELQTIMFILYDGTKIDIAKVQKVEIVYED